MTFQDMPGRPPAGTLLCRLDALADGQARNFHFDDGAGRFDMFLVRQDGVMHGYVNCCPHARTPLDWQNGDFFNRAKTLLLCGTHGALFRIDDGFCVRGPCPGRSLTAVPLVIVDGEIRVAG